MSDWTHNGLVADLVAHLNGGGRLVWADMQLGPAGSRRPDAYTIPVSFSRFLPLAYEAKVSVSDFRSDVTSGKWQEYLRFAAGVIFAVPTGLIGKDDVPTGCGLMVRGEAGWRTLKKPTMQRVDNLPREAWLKLLFDGVQRLRTPPEPRRADSWKAQEIIRKRHGDEIARLFSDVEGGSARLEARKQSIEHQLEHFNKYLADEKERLRREESFVDDVRRELALALGLSENANIHTIRAKAADEHRRLQGNAHFLAAQKALRQARITLDAQAMELSRLATSTDQEAAE